MSLNKVMVIGNLGRDAEVKFTPSGQAVANFAVATTDKWVTKDGEKKEQTEWHRIALWGKTAETLANYLTKGKQVYVEGKIRTRMWEKDGEKRSATEITAEKVVLLGTNRAQEPAPAAHDDDIPF